MSTTRNKDATKREMIPVQTRLDRDTAEQFKEIAELRGVSEAQLIRELVEKFLAETDVDALADDMREAVERRIAKLTRKKSR